jgi:hypothetical protein
MTAAIKTPDTRIIPRDIKGKFEIKHCGEAFTEWNHNIIGGENLYSCCYVALVVQ